MLVQHVLSGKRDHLPEMEYYAEPCVSVLHHPAKTEQEGVKSRRRVERKFEGGDTCTALRSPAESSSLPLSSSMDATIETPNLITCATRSPG